MVERQLPKLNVAGSIPVSRSIKSAHAIPHKTSPLCPAIQISPSVEIPEGWDEHADALCPIHSQLYREWVG